MPEQVFYNGESSTHIIGREPGWITRCGIGLLFVVILLLLALTWFIRYPDSIYSQVMLTSDKPSIALVTAVNARLKHIFVEDGEQVQSGQVVALLESSVDYPSFQQLQLGLQRYSKHRFANDLAAFELTELKELGNLQEAANQFYMALNEFRLEQQSPKLALRTKSVELMQSQYQSLLQQLGNKQGRLYKRIEIEKALLDKNHELERQGIIAESALAPYKKQALNNQLALDDIDIQLKLYQLRVSELQQELQTAQIKHVELLARLQLKLDNSYNKLLSKIEQWKKNYLLHTPIDGQVSFSNYWHENQYISRDKTLMNIASTKGQKVGKMYLPALGIGKVKIGQRVDIELSGFPAVEFGKLEGRVASIALVPDAKGYLVNVTLSQKLISSYGLALTFTPNMSGVAKVVTDDKRLLQRFFDKLLYAVQGST